MHVTFDPQIFLRQRTGGISRLFANLIREFDQDEQLGVAVSLPFRMTNNALLAGALAHRSLKKTPPWLPRGMLYAPWWVRGSRMRGQPDIVHHTYYSRRFLDAPSGTLQVTTIHDMIPELFAGTEGFTGTHLAKRSYVKTSDLIICVSNSTRQDMLEAFGDISQRTVVVPNGVQPDFKPGLPPVPGLPSEYLLYVGKRNGYKDFSLLPDALERLRDDGLSVPLVVVGAPLSSVEYADLQRRGLEHSVIQVSLNDEQLRGAYSNSSALVQTSRYEGFGLTPLEGMASGVPVVIARASSMPEVCGDVAVYFEPGDPNSLAGALSEVLTDEARRVDLARRGPDRAIYFSTRRMAERTAAAYRSVLQVDS